MKQQKINEMTKANSSVVRVIERHLQNLEATYGREYVLAILQNLRPQLDSANIQHEAFWNSAKTVKSSN